jgi:uncharacterized protein
MWRELGIAISLMLVLEGIIPFLQPARWRKMVALLATIDDRTMRLLGFTSMLTGTILLYIIN